jgi:hypothetical protein
MPVFIGRKMFPLVKMALGTVGTSAEHQTEPDQEHNYLTQTESSYIDILTPSIPVIATMFS